MSSQSKFCRECGAQLDIGLAQCPRCRAQVGTVFSEGRVASEASRSRDRQRGNESVDTYRAVEKARERANNALVLALASFFCPGLGLLLGAASIMLGLNAFRVLKSHQTEEGRGSASAGIIIGAIGLLAQFFYTIYAVKQGVSLFSP